MIKHLLYFVISIFILSPSVVKASIICPPDINLFCDADIHNTNVTGMPTVFGHPWALVTYEDQSFLNGCNTGYVLRKWYVDEDQNNTWSAGEPQCVQTITLAYIVAQTEVFFPPDRTFDCLEEVTNDRPDWYSGQCDMIGVNVKEDTFLVAPDACYKIMRHFRVINWCTYQPENPMWNGEGLWVHTQVIKVIDDRKPIMASCEKILIPTNKECAARVTLTNSAIDNAACASYLLSWKAEVDLWQDGTLDYVFSFTETGDFYLAPVSNGDEVSITLPKDVPQGIHSVKWAVRDQCGNFTSCTQKFEVRDTKAPTPYVDIFVTAAFDAQQGQLHIPATLFDIGSFDNCTQAKHLHFSFSSDLNDTIKIIDCDNAGFQFFTIFITDDNGNQDFAEVFMLVFDNNSCNGLKGNFEGTLSSLWTYNPSEVHVHMQNSRESHIVHPDQNGYIRIEDASLYDDYTVEVTPNDIPDADINVQDFALLKDYLFGSINLSNEALVAADIDGDGRVSGKDLYALRAMVLKDKQTLPLWRTIFDSPDSIHVQNLATLSQSLEVMQFDGHIDVDLIAVGDISIAFNPLPADHEFRIVQSNQGVFHLITMNNSTRFVQMQIDAQSSPYVDVYNGGSQERFYSTEEGYVHLLLENNEQSYAEWIIEIKDAEGKSIMLDQIIDSQMVDHQYRLIQVDRGQSNRHHSRVSIFPNPSQEFITLENGEIDAIIGVDGRQYDAIRSYNGQYDIRTLASGLYVVKISIRDEIEYAVLVKR